MEKNNFNTSSGLTPEQLAQVAEVVEGLESLIGKFGRAQKAEDLSIMPAASVINDEMMRLDKKIDDRSFDPALNPETPIGKRYHRALDFLMKKVDYLEGRGPDPMAEQDKEREALLETAARDFRALSMAAKPAAIFMEMPATTAPFSSKTVQKTLKVK